MFDVTRRFQLALSDLGRRSGLVVAAAVLLVVAAGFLLAALWTVLAHSLDWGPVLASLILAGLCVLVAGGLLLTARRARHAMPSAGDVQAEMEARAKLATAVAVGAVKMRAAQATASAGQHLHGLWDRARYQGDRAASDLEAEAARMAQAATQAGAKATGGGAPGLVLAGAFVIGVALAHFLRQGNDKDAAD